MDLTPLPTWTPSGQHSHPCILHSSGSRSFYICSFSGRMSRFCWSLIVRCLLPAQAWGGPWHLPDIEHFPFAPLCLFWAEHPPQRFYDMHILSLRRSMWDRHAYCSVAGHLATRTTSLAWGTSICSDTLCTCRMPPQWSLRLHRWDPRLSGAFFMVQTTPTLLPLGEWLHSRCTHHTKHLTLSPELTWLILCLSQHNPLLGSPLIPEVIFTILPDVPSQICQILTATLCGAHSEWPRRPVQGLLPTGLHTHECPRWHTLKLNLSPADTLFTCIELHLFDIWVWDWLFIYVLSLFCAACEGHPVPSQLDRSFNHV